MAQVWKCTGLRWAAGGPVLEWDGGRRSALPRGKRVAFAVPEGGGRTCAGARGHACPVRSALPGTEAERAAEVRELHARAVALSGWPESLRPESCEVVDQVRAFGLDVGPDAFGEVVALVPGGGVSGELVAVAGPDLHLAVGGRGAVVLDTRLMTGWELVPSESAAAGCAFPVREFGREPDGLF
ncbi:DUF2797 domain-containing protein [Streptomyces olivaceoviridis]|uniref:DUF2797 domain-containing protein n=1 Tax=Streptomyces olivaceoviridis TaxID=1921 RepID=UPI0036C272AD